MTREEMEPPFISDWRRVFRVRGWSFGRKVKVDRRLDAQHEIHRAQVAATRARLRREAERG